MCDIYSTSAYRALVAAGIRPCSCIASGAPAHLASRVPTAWPGSRAFVAIPRTDAISRAGFDASDIIMDTYKGGFVFKVEGSLPE